MSTKTLRKRIALVAVSALGFGLVGAAPSSAAAITCTAATGGLTVQAGVNSVIGTCDVSAAITTADYQDHMGLVKAQLDSAQLMVETMQLIEGKN